MNDASIGCVVPTLESARTLEMTLLSLASQRDVEVKIFVVDSGSADATLDICRRWNVATIYAEPGNMYRAINAGLARLDCEWLAYLNSDDWLLPGSFQRLIELGESTKADVVYGNCDYCDGAGRFVYGFTAARPDQLPPLFRLARMGFAQPAAIFRRSLYQSLNGFDEGFRFKADADFFIRALRSNARFAHLDGPSVACFRLHERQLSNRKRESIGEEGERLFNAPALAADWLALAGWQTRNLPNYFIRIVRESLLSKRLRFPRSVEPYIHR